jgi:hypothetical protein
MDVAGLKSGNWAFVSMAAVPRQEVSRLELNESNILKAYEMN